MFGEIKLNKANAAFGRHYFLIKLMYNEIMGLHDRVDQLALNLERLIEKAELWQLLFDEAPDAIALFDEEMRFFLVNRAFCELTLFTSEELAGQKISLVLPKQYRRAHKSWEKSFAAYPEKKVNRHGLTPTILDKFGNELPVGIDLSFFYYADRPYYTAFIRKL